MLVHAATKDVTTAAAGLRDIAILHCSQLEHVEQHRHVAAYAVALAGNRDQLVERRVATQRLADGVRRDREAGAANILLGQVGQNGLKFGVPLRVTAQNRPPGRADLPDAQKPDPVETLLCKAIQRGVVDVSQGDPLAGLARQTLKPDPRVDLKQRRITRHGPHSQTRLCRLYLSAEGCSPAGLQKGLGIELAENVDQAGDDPGPTRLMAGADPGAVVAMKVFVE